MSYQHIEGQTRAGRPGNPRPGADAAMADAALAALDAAVTAAQAGDLQRAREMCAAVVFDAQPMLAADRELLRGTLYALLVARAFKLLSRVVRAMSGRSLRVVVQPELAGPIAPPRMLAEPGRTICTLDPRWLDRLSPDDTLLRHWCDALIARRESRSDLPGIAPAARHLEPV